MAVGRLLVMYAALMGVFVGFGWLIASVFAGNFLLITALFVVFAVLMNAGAYFFSDRIVLFTYRARFVTEAEHPRLHTIVKRVAGLSGVPMPRVALVPSRTPNAFATGHSPKRAVVAATEGILDLLDDRELTGVIAHEMSHVSNRDILVTSVAATLAGAISIMARSVLWGSLLGGGRKGRDNGGAILLVILGSVAAGLAALLIRLAISRSREYKADYTGAKVLGTPTALADALQKLETANKRRPLEFGNPSHASLFIVNPFQGASLMGLFSTHPPMKERVRRLRAMSRTP